MKTNSNPVFQKVLDWSIRALVFWGIAYFAWYRIPMHLWAWANKAWWHWGPALPAFFVTLAPIWAIVGATPLRSATSVGTQRHLWWAWVAYFGTTALGLLLLWAFTPAPARWVGWHWWLWSVAVIGLAVLSAAGHMFLTVHAVRAPLARDSFSHEWRFNRSDVNSPPNLGIAMSGGGIRSAAFNLGVLQALHAKGILSKVDVMSAVSGGSYTMSWYLLQPFYAARAASNEHTKFNIDAVINEMFDPRGKFQAHLCYDPPSHMIDFFLDIALSIVFDMTLLQPLRAFAAMGRWVGVYNSTGMVRKRYRERIQELYQGLPSPGSPDEIENEIDFAQQQDLDQEGCDFCCVTPVSYRELADFAQQNGLPFFIYNASILVERRGRNRLWPTTFELTADDLGSDVCGYRTWDDLKQLEITAERKNRKGVGFWQRVHQHVQERSAEQFSDCWVAMVNVAPAISGAAVGLSYFNRRNPLKTKLTTWTPFVGNLDLGYLLPRQIWKATGAVYLSDGGHAENLGAYALIKRRCRQIIIVDAEHEKAIPYVFVGYSKLKKQLKAEMELVLEISDIDSYLEQAKGASKPTGPARAVMTGEAKSLDPNAGVVPISVIYIKLGLQRERLDSYPPQVSDYARKSPCFPQDPTSNQVFTSEQFAAYRELGRHVAAALDEVLKIPREADGVLRGPSCPASIH